MKNRTLYLSVLSFGFIFFLSSCRAPKELEYRDFKNLKVEKIGAASSMIKLDLVYYNPNNFGLQLKLTDLDIYVDNNYLGHSLQEYQIHIPKRGEFTLPVQVEVEMKNLLKNALSTFLGKDVTLKVTGKVTLGKANVYKIFPVNYEGVHKFSLY
ncbi:MAG TPA: LEA type 2 family protein [Ferruginibacter sp.]|nr:LEA type 2 family protein [Ferruginibacter sp.]